MDAFKSILPPWILLVLMGILSLLLFKLINWKSKVDIERRYVLITGCDSGFGREIAVRLDQIGAFVLATCLTEDGERSLKAVTSYKLKTFQMDVTNSKQIEDVYQEVCTLIPTDMGLWGLVNNAGIMFRLPIEWTPLSTFKRTADVNLWGMIDVSKTFLPLVKRARGRVVNFSSVAGRVAFGFYASYAVTKYGVEAFSDALRREMYPWGVQVSILEPGGFKTNICNIEVIEEQFTNGWNDLSTEVKKEYGEEFLQRGLDFFAQADAEDSPDLNTVVDAVQDALMSRSPRDRYILGKDARFLVNWVSRFPTAIEDLILRMLLNPPYPADSMYSESLGEITR